MDTSAGKALVPWGKRLCVSFDIYCPSVCKINMDINNHANSGSSWNGNDNDKTSARVYSGKSIPANTWVRRWFSYENTNTNNTNKVDLYDTSGFGVLRSDSDAAMTYYIKNIKYELQDPSANGPATMYTPAWTDSDSIVNTEYDTSGFGNHGAAATASAPTWSSDSPRYDGCYLFNGSSQFLTAPQSAKITDEITASIWAYMGTWGGYICLISCTEVGGWNIKYTNDYISFLVYAGDSYRICKSSKKWTSLTSGWHHFAVTYNGLKSCLYIDGVLDTSITPFTTKTPITYNSGNTIFIGAEAASNATAPTTPYFNGKLSDFRLYATALSAEDIKELYNSPIAVTNTGVLMTQGEFKEE